MDSKLPNVMDTEVYPFWQNVIKKLQNVKCPEITHWVHRYILFHFGNETKLHT